ncbi:unnamed protein product [Cochlearia groenlandica]
MLKKKIGKTLRSLGYVVEDLSIHVVCGDGESRVKECYRNAFAKRKTRIEYTDLVVTSDQATDVEIKRLITEWTLEVPPPENLMIITGDGEGLEKLSTSCGLMVTTLCFPTIHVV